MKKKIVYAEPADYIPEELRRKYKLGEFAEMNTMDETVTIETVSQGDGNTTKITLEPAEGSKKLEDDEELEKWVWKAKLSFLQDLIIQGE